MSTDDNKTYVLFKTSKVELLEVHKEGKDTEFVIHTFKSNKHIGLSSDKLESYLMTL